MESEPPAALAEMSFESPAGATMRITREAVGEPDPQAQVAAWENGARTGRYALWAPDSPMIETLEWSDADPDGAVGGVYSCCCPPCCSGT